MFRLSRSRVQLTDLSKIFLNRAFCSVAEKRVYSGPKPLFVFPSKQYKNAILYRNLQFSFYSTGIYKGPISRNLRRRIMKREKAAARPVLNRAMFERAISQLPPRFTPEEVHDVMVSLDDPLVCLEIFNWAAQDHRFRHNVLTYHVTVKKLGAAKMYKEMEDVINQVLAIRSIGSEALFNTMIHYLTAARKLVRAVNVFNHMHASERLDCRPSVRTYSILMAAFLNQRKNTCLNQMYMENVKSLFKKMINDGVEPDIYCLNSMIKGYVISKHIDEAIRIFHQMGPVYNCQPNTHSYDYLIYGLCVQGRTNNAREFCDGMKQRGFVPDSRSYNSIVCSLALEGKVDDAVNFLWEMADNQRSADFITYQTVVHEVYRQKKFGDAVRLLKELQEKNHVDGAMHARLLNQLEDDSRTSNIP